VPIAASPLKEINTMRSTDYALTPIQMNIPVLVAAALIGMTLFSPQALAQEKPKASLQTAPRLKDGCLKPDFGGLKPMEGQATLSLQISESGLPLSAQVIESSGSKGHDEATIAAALKCKFFPGTLNREPALSQYLFSYAWPENSASIGPHKCLPPAYPRRSAAYEEQGDVIVAFRLDAHSGQIESKISKSSGFPLLDKATLLAVTQCLEHEEARQGLPNGKWVLSPFSWRLEGIDSNGGSDRK
jgi:TonB family protein